MHGLICRSIQAFLQETYGHAVWKEISDAAEAGIDNFEAMLAYDDRVIDSILLAASQRFDIPKSDLLEDLGLFLVTHPDMHGLRRLLRFGGETFVEFLFSLEEMKHRAQMAVADLDLPSLELRQHSSAAYSVIVTHKQDGFGSVLVGVLRAMADDYGTLAFIQHAGSRNGEATLVVDLIETEFAAGREFSLAG